MSRRSFASFTPLLLAALCAAAAGCAQTAGEVCQLGTPDDIMMGRGSDCEGGLICCKTGVTPDPATRGICRTEAACSMAQLTDSGAPTPDGAVDSGTDAGSDGGAEDASAEDATVPEDGCAACSTDAGSDSGPEDAGAADDAGSDAGLDSGP